MWIDSHCHLNHANFEGRTPADIIADFSEHKIDGCITICCRISKELPTLIDIADAHKNVYCTIGTHPHDAGNADEKAISKDELVTLSQSSKQIVGIGESGLDYFYNYATVEEQKSSFRKHIHACQETGLPLIIHSRDADEDMIAILKEEYTNAPFKAVLHCFSSGEKLAMDALDMDMYVSFSGIVTFKKSSELQDIAKKIPLNRILVETDAPFLAPPPYRGKINQPSYVRFTGEFLAEIRDEATEDFARATRENTLKFFDRADFDIQGQGA